MSDISGRRVLVGMSGGVDSSAAALLLLRQGCAVSGLTLLLTPTSSERSAEVADARAVCEKLGISHHTLDLRDQFRRDVIERFAAEYVIGRTPNPCVECNRTIKFGAMLDYALANGFDAIATGHYVSKGYDPARDRYVLYRTDSAKDQSYVLWQLSQKQLKHAMFPVAGCDKPQLRRLAEEAGLPVYAKKDSQDICFVPDGDYSRFLERECGCTPRPGSFVGTDGGVLGRHSGVINYTIGQRKGLGGGFPHPMYVVGINADRAEVVLGGEEDLRVSQIECEGANYLSVAALDAPREVMVKVRYSARPAAATIEPLDENRVLVRFERPQRAPTPGQSAVFYDGSELFGGAFISRTVSSD